MCTRTHTKLTLRRTHSHTTPRYKASCHSTRILILAVTLCYQFVEQIELPAKLLDYFLRSNKRNINQWDQCLAPNGRLGWICVEKLRLMIMTYVIIIWLICDIMWLICFAMMTKVTLMIMAYVIICVGNTNSYVISCYSYVLSRYSLYSLVSIMTFKIWVSFKRLYSAKETYTLMWYHVTHMSCHDTHMYMTTHMGKMITHVSIITTHISTRLFCRI